ncbi:MAG: ribosome-associated protein [Candidatus Tokpelaia sp. JSC085]|nr:MAG: ribosome-associated protein [Candidatus Tokpelaia sp. JSC085]
MYTSILADTQSILADTSYLKEILVDLEDSGAEEAVCREIRKKSAIADFVVIASGHSQRHVMAIAHHLLRRLKKIGCKNIQVEGLSSRNWVLIDIGDIIVHILHPEVRSFYELDKIWIDQDHLKDDLDVS